MLKIRLQRAGKRNQPKFRLVLIDSRRAAKSGSFLEVLGAYDPKTKKSVLKKERINELKSKGAILSDTVREMLKKLEKTVNK